MYRIQQLVKVSLQLVLGIFEVFKTAGSFEELERRIQRLSQQTTAELVKPGLEEIDSRLAADRDKRQLENLGKKERTILTTAGEIIGGDGALWIKDGLEVFPGASYHLDHFRKDKPTKQDWSEWLATDIPALYGQQADKMWIKYVLREISRINAMTA